MTFTPFKRYQRRNSIVFRQVHPPYKRTVYTGQVHPAYKPWLKDIKKHIRMTRHVPMIAMYQGREVEITKRHPDGACVIAWHDRWHGWIRTTVPSVCLTSVRQYSPLAAKNAEIAALRREVGNPSELDRVMEGSRPLRERYKDALEVVRRQAVRINELEEENEALKSAQR